MKMQNAVTVDVNPEADREIEFVQQEDDNENEEDEEGLMKAMVAELLGDRLVATTEKQKDSRAFAAHAHDIRKRRRKREWQLSLVYSPDGRCLI